jgi:tetratricopeptide (TPR) repeat protein
MAHATLSLPPRPARDATRGSVSAWAEPVVIPTYEAMAPDPNPMFLEKRVYQGSSGRVYPNPFTDRISDRRVDRPWPAVHLVNEYVRIMVVPELGGRIFVGRDETNGYDFFYRQDVVKPALVGLLGPWISGGVEFNWPQHHRPSTYMPAEWTIERDADGSATVWCSEHEPMTRMKGMHGIRLRPGSSVVEVRVRLYNRTPLVQTFLWWANVATEVHDEYESFFPPDVTYVADHAKRAMSRFPIARGTYYGVDYGARSPDEASLAWYRNIPVPTSYMALDSAYDFFGGYDHRADAGVVHIADHRIAPGKKQWTWGDAAFGHAWDRELSDDGRPYIELMAGVYTDNQPDFSFLAPYETKTFSQAWYPLRGIGPADLANLDAAVSLRPADGRARVGVNVTVRRPGAHVVLRVQGGKVLDDTVADLAPDAPYVAEIGLPAGVDAADLELAVTAADGHDLIRHRPVPRTDRPIPAPATEPPLPEAVGTIEELYLTGLHLEQYRHATRDPEPYWREALRRDPGDVRSNTALARWHLRRGEAEAAERLARTALTRLTGRNPNPYDGEPAYVLGLALRLQGRDGEARDAFTKAGWNAAWWGPASHALAELTSAAGSAGEAIAIIERALDADADDLNARDLGAAILRRSGRADAALAVVEETLARDPLDAWATWERRLLTGTAPEALRASLPADEQTRLDVAFDYAAAGLADDAIRLLETFVPAGSGRSHGPVASPMVHYTLGHLRERLGDVAGAARCRAAGRAADPTYCFPSRLEEIAVLRSAIAADPDDPRAPYYLGLLLYDRRRYAEAVALWERAAELDPAFPTVHRNLGIAAFNHLGRPRRARAAYEAALAADPDDARLLYEADQLAKRMNVPSATRLRRLEARRDLVDRRDDLSVELATLRNDVGRHEDALRLILGRRFHPWEGGEGLVATQYETAHLRLADRALERGRADEALAHAQAAERYPASLGEGRHLLAPRQHILRRIGLALRAAGDEEGAVTALSEAAVPPAAPSAATYEAALALRALGDEPTARALLRGLGRHAKAQAGADVRIDYFATSLPDFLLFEDDLARRNRIECRYLEGLAALGLERPRAAERAFRDVIALDGHHQGALGGLASIAGRSRRRRRPGVAPRGTPRTPTVKRPGRA